MKSSQITATRLRIILSVSLFLILALSALIFNFAYRQLSTVAVTVSERVADSTASDSTIRNLEAIEKTLAKDRQTIDRVASIVADSKSYQYQNQIIYDLNNYANKAGIKITNLDFSSTTAAPAPATAAAPLVNTPAPSGVKSTSVSITLANPIEYNALLRFIKSIEQNLTKMQISNVSLSKGEQSNQVVTDALTIEVYVK